MNQGCEPFLDVDFNWVSSLQGIWSDPPGHVESLQKSVVDGILRDFKKLDQPESKSAIGHVVNGPAGSGKTHLIGTPRRRVWEKGGWFILIETVGITDFWRTAAFAFIRSLRQAMPNGQSQYEAVFETALRRVPAEKRTASIQEGNNLGTGAIQTVNLFIRLLQGSFQGAFEHTDIIRALLLSSPSIARRVRRVPQKISRRAC